MNCFPLNLSTWLKSVAIFVGLCGSALQAEPLQIPKINGTLTIDAELNETEWQQAKAVDIIYNTWPSENTPAPVKTTAYVMENGEFFYVAFIAEDPDPSAIRAFYHDRDKIWNDDNVGIKLDTYNDSKLAYQFFINPLGVQADAIENEITKSESDAWDGIWHSAGKITTQGYQIEVAIPLRLLNFNDRLALQQWKLELLRFYPREIRHRLSSNPILRENPCWICQMSPVQGFAGATQGNHLTLIPALVLAQNEQRAVSAQAVADWQSESKAEPSLDAKWGITPDINLNMTLNPDFSQIEADEAQVSVNDTFSLYFDEKRTFFLDNADYFSTPLDLVYTRNVSSPDVGVKLTGRHNQHSFAFFAANDTSTQFVIPGNISSDEGFLAQKSENAVLRYRQDLTTELSLGWISTLRHSDDYHNYVHGLDVKYQWDDQNKIIAQRLYSDSQYPLAMAADYNGEAALRLAADPFSDQASYLAYEHKNRQFSWYSRFHQLGEHFRADMGYMPQTDWQKQVHGGTYQWFLADQWLNRLQLWADWDISHNSAGELLEKETEVELQFWGQQQTYAFVGFTQRARVGSRLDGTTLRVDGNSQLFEEQLWSTGFETQPIAGVFVGLYTEQGKKLDFRNNRLGDGVEWQPELKWHLNAHLQLHARHIYRALEAQGAPVFTARLTDLRLSYQFSVRSFLRLALIYSNNDMNPQNNLGQVQANRKSLGSQLLYSYKLNPQTLLFAGYSDNAFENDQVQDLTRNQRSVFLKFSYAWML